MGVQQESVGICVTVCFRMLNGFAVPVRSIIYLNEDDACIRTLSYTLVATQYQLLIYTLHTIVI